MRFLPAEFRHGRFDYRLLDRVGDVVLLAKRNEQMNRDTYEICVVRTCADRRIAGKFIPARECLPAPEHWGLYGFTETTLERAQMKFHALVKSRCSPKAAAPSTAATAHGPQTALGSKTPSVA